MSRLKQLSGSEVVKIFLSFGFQKSSQKGSHTKLKRVLSSGEKQILIVPAHSHLDKGTLRAIIRQASKFVSIDKLEEKLYTE